MKVLLALHRSAGSCCDSWECGWGLRGHTSIFLRSALKPFEQYRRRAPALRCEDAALPKGPAHSAQNWAGGHALLEHARIVN